MVVTKVGRCYGRTFKPGRVLNQGEPVSTIVFNIMLDAVVRVVLLEVCGPQEYHHELGWVAVYHNIVFYADGGRVS